MAGGAVVFANECLVFGIPIEPEYRDIARQAWRDLRLSIQYGPQELIPADRARTELVLAIADELRRRGETRPLYKAWELVGTPDPKEFSSKLELGQPLGDLTSNAVLKKFMPLVLGRLKHFRVAGDEDARAAAELGLLNALAGYDPAVDVSVGLFAKVHRLVDDEIKRAIRGKDSDALSHERVSGDEELFDDEGGGSNDRWEVMPKATLSDETVALIESAHDDLQRLQPSRIPFSTALWIAETNPERPSFGARFESWTSLPASPLDMADFVAAIPADKVASELTRLSKLEQDIVTRRFFRKPPILLDTVARDRKISDRRRLTIAHRAIRQIADAAGIHKPIKTRPPIRRPMRPPSSPRQLPLRPHGPPDFRYRRVVEEIWLAPLLDSVWQTVNATRPAGTDNPDNLFDPA